jgi:hypothetical protein
MFAVTIKMTAIETDKISLHVKNGLSFGENRNTSTHGYRCKTVSEARGMDIMSFFHA